MELSIGELSRQTGVPVATLRSWESRFGEPQALPRSGGHRRYDGRAVDVVRGILARRAAGMTLPAAVTAAADGDGTEVLVPPPDDEEQSVYVALHRAHPEIAQHRLSKATVLSLTHAIEDEYVARSTRALLFACFQRGQFFAQSEERWQDLSRVAEVAVVMADFRGHELPEGAADDRLVHVALAEDSPLQREWLVVCDSDDYPVCMAARELLGSGGRDSQRQFETLWSLDPEAVRTAARLCAALAVRQHPAAASRLRSATERLQAPPAPASSDLQRATSLFGRLVAYLEASS